MSKIINILIAIDTDAVLAKYEKNPDSDNPTGIGHSVATWSPRVPPSTRARARVTSASLPRSVTPFARSRCRARTTSKTASCSTACPASMTPTLYSASSTTRITRSRRWSLTRTRNPCRPPRRTKLSGSSRPTSRRAGPRATRFSSASTPATTLALRSFTATSSGIRRSPSPVDSRPKLLPAGAAARIRQVPDLARSGACRLPGSSCNPGLLLEHDNSVRSRPILGLSTASLEEARVAVAADIRERPG